MPFNPDQKERESMRRVRFFVEGQGPFEGMMKFGLIGDGEIEFIAIPAQACEFTTPEIMRVVPEDESPFEAPVIDIITDASRYDEAGRTMSGFVVFETI